ncbi:unnamed protein product, partial [Mesorhabditis belari]|uniref:Solute carrier family 40 member n=1 Tax=Mesorhabditis belari TaxID=2138241 RepID=A0AAF3ETJ6_9BILA
MKEKTGKKISIRSVVQDENPALTNTVIVNGAYLFSTFGDRLWMFAVGIFMTRIGGLSWVAIQQLVDSLTKLLLLPMVGTRLDKFNRNRGMQLVLLCNNLSIVVSACAFYVGETKFAKESGALKHIALIMALIFGSISRVASEAQRITFNKDWIIVLVENTNGATRLSTQNSIMGAIDHAANMIAPVIVGGVIDNISSQACCIFIILWNIVSWILEGFVLFWVYKRTPALATKKGDEKFEVEQALCGISAFKAYKRQSCFRAAFGLALLYMTVLGFDNLAISYGLSQGVSASALGSLRSFGALLGMLGIFTYTLMERTIGLVFAAFIGLLLQNIAINLCSTSTVLPGNPFNATGFISNMNLQEWSGHVKNGIMKAGLETDKVQALPIWQLPPSIILFFTGITLARYGLWIADPAISQIMQHTIPERERYTVFGAQTAICEFFSVIKDLLVISFPVVEMFGLLSLISCCFVFTGFLFYFSYFIKNLRTKFELENENDKELIEIGAKSETVPLAEFEKTDIEKDV